MISEESWKGDGSLLHQARCAARYSEKCYSLCGDTRSTWHDDIVQVAALGMLEHPNDPNAGRKAADSFIRSQILMKGRVGGKPGKPERRLDVDKVDIPVIALARLVRAINGRNKSGRRTRHSAALKALILRDIANGDTFRIVADRYNVSYDNAKRHYYMAWKALRHYLVRYSAIMSAEQRALLQESIFN